LHFLGTWCPYRPRENSRPLGGSPGAGGADADSPDWQFFVGAGLTTDAIPAGSDLDLMLSCTRRAHALAMPQASVRRSGQTAWCGMHFYLPVAEMSANVFIFLAMGGAVGFLSGLFGVGGGFLMTPLLIFSGIPPAVAVGTESAQIAASSVSGAFAQWRRKNIDFTMGAVLLAGGIVGSVFGVQLVGSLRRLGLFDFFVAACYVTFLGVIGTLMLIESINTMRKTRAGASASSRRPGQHNWIHRLPLKLRFQRSKLYISAIPPLLIGLFVGLLAAIMGVGGGFIMVPAMIYLLRVPTNIVVGTSLFQIVFLTAATTVLHASQNQTVDVVLAVLLMLGGVVGAQFGAVAGERLKAEQLRFLLAALVLMVGLRFAWQLIAPPSDLYSFAASGGA